MPASSQETLTAQVRSAPGGWGRLVGVLLPRPASGSRGSLFALSFPTRRPRGVGQVRGDADASSSGGGEPGSQAPGLCAEIKRLPVGGAGRGGLPLPLTP